MPEKTNDMKPTGAIVVAKKSMPVPVPQATENVSDYWNRKSGGTLQGMAAQLQKYNPKSAGGSTALLTFEAEDQSQFKQPTTGVTQIEEQKARPMGSTGATTAVGADASARAILLNALSDMYKIADKSGLKTRDQFATSFESLLGTTSKRNRDLLNDPRFQQQISNLKDVAGQHYADLIRERDAEKKTPAVVEKVTTTTVAPAAKLKVPKR